MFTVRSLAQEAGTTVRTVQYYDSVGILPATERTDTGYRLYDPSALLQLKEILQLRHLGLGLEQIRSYLGTDTAGRLQLLEEQICRLEAQKQDCIDRICQVREFSLQLRETAGFVCPSSQPETEETASEERRHT